MRPDQSTPDSPVPVLGRTGDSIGALREVPTAGRRYVAVAQQLLDAIERGDFPPGEQLPAERDIAALTGVSRATAREALLALEIIGVLRVQPGRGAFVAERGEGRPLAGAMALEAPRELVEARLQVEPAAARLCAQRIRPAELAELQDLVRRSEAAATSARPHSELSSLGLRFHAQVAAASGNRFLSDIVGRLVDVEHHPLWVLVNQLALGSDAGRHEQRHEHESIVEAIASGDAELAASRMHQHLLQLAELFFGP